MDPEEVRISREPFGTQRRVLQMDRAVDGCDSVQRNSLGRGLRPRASTHQSSEHQEIGEIVAEIMKFFEYSHLSTELQHVSKQVCDTAVSINGILPESAEKSAGLRKLLEAKDCFVRAALSK